jgi:PAS domain S-box-containing protein
MKIASECNDEGLYRDIFVEAPFACFSIGIDGRVLAANKQALGLLGYRQSEVLGRPVLDLYADTPTGKVKAEEQFLKFSSGAEFRAAALEMRRADGTPVWITLSVRAIRDRMGRVAASCSIVEEIAKRLSPAGLSPFQWDRDPIVFVNGVDSFASMRNSRPTQESLKRFLIKSGSAFHFVKVEDIDWVEAAGNYVELHIGTKSHLIRNTMNALEARLDPRRFLRVHRSAIVNVERIKELRPWRYGDHKIALSDGTQLILKRCYIERLEQMVGEPL